MVLYHDFHGRRSTHRHVSQPCAMRRSMKLKKGNLWARGPGANNSLVSLLTDGFKNNDCEISGSKVQSSDVDTVVGGGANAHGNRSWYDITLFTLT